jgi:hypothetical protein
MVTMGMFPFKENSHDRTENWPQDLMISSKTLTTRPRGKMFDSVKALAAGENPRLGITVHLVFV